MLRTINIGTAAAPEDPYAQAQQQQAYADALTARAVGQPIAPLSSTGSAWEQGLSQLGQALLGARLHQIARGSVQNANAQQDASNQAKLDALAPNTPGSSQPQNVHLDAVNPDTPQIFQAPTAQQIAAPPGTGQGPTAPPPTDSPVDMTLNRETPQALSPQHQILSAAIAGMDPRTASAVLSNTILRNALPDPEVVAREQDRRDALQQSAEQKAAALAQQRDLANQADQTRRDIAQEGNDTRRALAASKPQPEPLSPDTIQNAGWDLLQDPSRIRQYASFGQTGQDIRNQANNAKTALMKQAGITEPEVLRLQAEAHANIKSVGDLIPMRNAVSAYETVAKANGDRFLQLANKVNNTGVPLLNSASRLGQLATGSPDAAEMMQVLQNYQTEVARIIANPTLKGQLTDTARQEVMNAVPANLTPAQASRIVQRLNFEFELRGRGLDDSIAKAQAGIAPGAPPPAPSGLPSPTQAPQPALDMLKAHPELGPQFKAKYGYLPSG